MVLQRFLPPLWGGPQDTANPSGGGSARKKKKDEFVLGKSATNALSCTTTMGLYKPPSNTGCPASPSGLPMNRRLLEAVVKGASHEVHSALRCGADVSTIEFGGITPLHKAAFRGDVETCRVLLKQAAMVDAKDSAGQTPLHAAALQLQPQVVQLLVRWRASADAADKEGVTPARAATARFHRRLEDVGGLAMCLEHITRAYDSELNTHNTKIEAEAFDPELDRPLFGCEEQLSSAASPCDRNGIEKVRVAWASPGRPGSSSRPGSGRAGSNRPVSSRPESNRPGSRPGSRCGSGEVQAGGCCSREDSLQSASTTMTTIGGQCRSGSTPPWSDRSGSGASAWMTVTSCFREMPVEHPPLIPAVLRGDVELVRALLRQRAQPNCPDSTGQTPLHAAAVRVEATIVGLLLRNRADVTVEDKEGATPLRAVVGRLHAGGANGSIDLRHVAVTLDLLLQAQERELHRLRTEARLAEAAQIPDEFAAARATGPVGGAAAPAAPIEAHPAVGIGGGAALPP